MLDVIHGSGSAPWVWRTRWVGMQWTQPAGAERRHRESADSNSEPFRSKRGQTAPETSSQRSTRNASIVGSKATKRASDGRSAPIWINPDPARPDWETGKAHTTMRDQKDPESGRPKRV